MEAYAAKNRAEAGPQKARANYFMTGTEESGAAAAPISFSDFTSKRMGWLSKEPTQAQADAMGKFLLSKEFQDGFSDIRRISEKAGKSGIGALSESEQFIFGNFAANFNAIVKNKALFSVLEEAFDSSESLAASVSKVFSGDARAGFSEVGKLLAESEKLGTWDRMRLLKLLV